MDTNTPMHEQDTFQFNLIEGVFDREELIPLMRALIGSKITFHQKEIIGKWEREGRNCDFSRQRIETLKAADHALGLWLEKARESADSTESFEIAGTVSVRKLNGLKSSQPGGSSAVKEYR